MRGAHARAQIDGSPETGGYVMTCSCSFQTLSYVFAADAAEEWMRHQSLVLGFDLRVTPDDAFDIEQP